MDEVGRQQQDSARLCEMHERGEYMLVREPAHVDVMPDRLRGGMRRRSYLCGGKPGFFESVDGSHKPIVTPRFSVRNRWLRTRTQRTVTLRVAEHRKRLQQMPWYTDAARKLKAKGVSNAAIGRRLNITGQAVQMKLAGKRPTTVTEAKVFAEFMGVPVAEMLGEDAYLIEVRDEIELVELYRPLTPAQREQWLAYGRFLASANEPQT